MEETSGPDIVTQYLISQHQTYFRNLELNNLTVILCSPLWGSGTTLEHKPSHFWSMVQKLKGVVRRDAHSKLQFFLEKFLDKKGFIILYYNYV